MDRRICVCKGIAGMLAWVGMLTAVHADEIYPRAAAAAGAQQLAGAIEHGVAPFGPALPALAGRAGTVAFEHALGSIFRALDAYPQAEAHWRRAQQAAAIEGDDAMAADIAIERGEIALLIGDYERAERLSADLAALAARAKLSWAEATAEEYLGVIDRRHGKLDTALAHEQRALELQQALGNPVGVATALSNLGTLSRDRGDFARALDLFLQSLAIRRRTETNLELTLRNLALIYRDLGDDATTRRYFSQALEVAARHGDSGNYAATLGTYAGYLADAGEFGPALAGADEALAVTRAIGNRPSLGFNLLDSGRALLGLGRVAEAAERIEAALALGRELNQREIVSRSLVTLAEAALERGDRQQAHRLIDETFAALQSGQFKPQLAEAYALREKLAIAEGEPAKALEYAHRQAALREELLGTRASRRLSALESQYARAASEQKLALVTKDNELQAVRLGQQQLQRAYGIAVLLGLSALLALVAWRFVGVRRLNHALAVRNAEIESQRAALSRANERLEHQAQELYQAAVTDPLTGVSNRGHLMRQLDARVTDCERNGRELAVLLVDFDHFKQINDARGHLFGDRVLIAGVQTMRQWLEPGDLLGRYGGEEFVIAICDRDIVAVRALAERLRVRVAETLAAFAPELTTIATISIGIAQLSTLRRPVRLEDLIEASDRAVYKAKADGRNRVIHYAAA